MTAETSPARLTPRALPHIAAILYLILAVCSGFGFFVRGRLIKTGDATTTAMALYVLLRDVHRHVAGAMVRASTC